MIGPGSEKFRLSSWLSTAVTSRKEFLILHSRLGPSNFSIKASSGIEKVRRTCNASSNSCFITILWFDPFASNKVLPSSKLLNPRSTCCSFHTPARLWSSTASKMNLLAPRRHWNPQDSSGCFLSNSTINWGKWRAAVGVTSLQGSVSPSVMLPQRSEELPARPTWDGRGLDALADGDVRGKTTSLERAICNQARATCAAGMATPVSASFTLSVQVFVSPCFEPTAAASGCTSSDFEAIGSCSAASPTVLAGNDLTSRYAVGRKVASTTTKRQNARINCPKTTATAIARITVALICHGSTCIAKQAAKVKQ